MRTTIASICTLLLTITAAQAQPVTGVSARNRPQLRAISESASAPATNLIIYRKYAEPTIWAATVKIDGKKVGSIKNGEYIALKVDPGAHKLTIGWSALSGQKGGGIDFELGDGATVRYLEVIGTSRLAGVSYTGLLYRMGSGVAEVEPSRGQKSVAECCRLKSDR